MDHRFGRFGDLVPIFGYSLVAQRLKRLPAMQEMWVRFLVWEGPLEKEMATHSSILAWRILWTEECPFSLQHYQLPKTADPQEKL